jgi:hypothetical protein
MGKRLLAVAVALAAPAAAWAQQHSQCWLASQGQLNSGTNPTDAEAKAQMQSLAAAWNIPFEVLAAIGYQESGIRQFASDGYLLHNVAECQGLFNGNASPNPPGLGMMQLTGGTAQSYNLTLLRTDWKYNLEAGVKVLNGKFAAYKANSPPALATANEANRSLIENWYMACWYYNGYVGNSGSYADKIFAHIQNRPGKLVNFLPSGLNPTEPDGAIPHFFNSAYGESFVAKPDGTWLCEHGQTFSAPVTPTNSAGGTPPPPPGGTPPPAPSGPAVNDGINHAGGDSPCSASSGADGGFVLALIGMMALARRARDARRNPGVPPGR